jgi:hypothetical protein
MYGLFRGTPERLTSIRCAYFPLPLFLHTGLHTYERNKGNGAAIFPPRSTKLDPLAEKTLLD